MLKPLTLEGRFECGLDTFVAVPGEAHASALGVAIADEPGYHPIPDVWCHADNRAEMRAHADTLNAERGLDQLAAVRIVASSMRRPFA